MAFAKRQSVPQKSMAAHHNSLAGHRGHSITCVNSPELMYGGQEVALPSHASIFFQPANKCCKSSPGKKLLLQLVTSRQTALCICISALHPRTAADHVEYFCTSRHCYARCG